MRALAIGAAVAAVLFLTTGGHLILVPLILAPVSLLALRRLRGGIARLGKEALGNRRPLNIRHPVS